MCGLAVLFIMIATALLLPSCWMMGVVHGRTLTAPAEHFGKCENPICEKQHFCRTNTDPLMGLFCR